MYHFFAHLHCNKRTSSRCFLGVRRKCGDALSPSEIIFGDNCTCQLVVVAHEVSGGCDSLPCACQRVDGGFYAVVIAVIYKGCAGGIVLLDFQKSILDIVIYSANLFIQDTDGFGCHYSHRHRCSSHRGFGNSRLSKEVQFSSFTVVMIATANLHII